MTGKVTKNGKKIKTIKVTNVKKDKLKFNIYKSEYSQTETY